ncbi:MAG: N-acetylneuraminate synthase [Candidatus Electrothrix sp. AU1_5]|nr:N-acetylneuraminate synthase [Candidatus Electrothrix gigas]
MLEIDHRVIGPDQPAFLIAEVAQAHDGSLGMAHAYIDAAAAAGVDAIKFQTHIAAAESTLDEPFRVKFSQQDKTRFAYWQRMEFSCEQWQGLKYHAQDKGLIFLSSPFSLAAIELLEKIGVSAWKVGSGETVSGDILPALIATGKPIIASTGMSSFAEMDVLVDVLAGQKIPFSLLQCTSKYPVNLSEVGLEVLQKIRKRYNCSVGLSDHSGSPFPALAAMAQGAEIIEAHIVFDKQMYGPDTLASLCIEDFKLLADARDAFHTMKTYPVDKDGMAKSMEDMRCTFGKSLAVTRNLHKHELLTEEVLTAKKPGTGISLEKKEAILGKRVKKDVLMNTLLNPDDIEGYN